MNNIVLLFTTCIFNVEFIPLAPRLIQRLFTQKDPALKATANLKKFVCLLKILLLKI